MQHMTSNRGYCTAVDGRDIKPFKFDNTREGIDLFWSMILSPAKRAFRNDKEDAHYRYKAETEIYSSGTIPTAFVIWSCPSAHSLTYAASRPFVSSVAIMRSRFLSVMPFLCFRAGGHCNFSRLALWTGRLGQAGSKVTPLAGRNASKHLIPTYPGINQLLG